MPLLLPNTAPIPVTMQADDPNAGKYSTRDKSGTEYGIKQLLEDIKVSFDKAKLKIVDSDYKKGINKTLDDAFEAISTDPKFASIRDKWLINWSVAYQKNPTINISEEISNFVRSILDPSKTTTGGKWIVEDMYMNKTPAASFLAEDVATELTTFMNELPSDAKTPSLPMNFKTLTDTMDNEIRDVLKKFNLDWDDDSKDSGVASFKKLSAQALLAIDKAFDDADVIVSGRPYRDPSSFDQASVSAAAKEQFENLYHTQEWVDTLAVSAMQKAKKKLQEILDKADASKLDTRTLGVINDFTKWTKTQEGRGAKTPPELFKSLLGDTTGKDFLDWMKKWGGMLKISHTEYIKDRQVTVGIDVSLLDGAIVLPNEMTFPDLKINLAALKAKGVNTDFEELKTKEMTVMESSYSTDELKTSYEKYILNVKPTSAINEDNFDAFLSSLHTDVSKLTDGQEFKDVTIDQMMALNPEVFKDFKVQVGKAKDVAGKQSYATGWSSNVGITFVVEYNIVGGIGKLKITPTIKDDAIETIPPFQWDNTLDPKIAASAATKAKIIQLFKAADKKHEMYTVPDIKAIQEKLVSPLYAKAAEIAGALGKATEVDPKPFEVEYNGKLGDGEVVSLDFIKDTFPAAKAKLAYFDDLKSRFKIKFTISEWEETTRTMSVSYEITDTQGAKLTTDVDGPDTKNPLVTQDIIFNKDRNKAYKLLQELKDSKKGTYDKFNTRAYVDAIKTRTNPPAMTDEEFKAIFLEYNRIHKEGADNGIALTKRKVEFNTETGRWEQWFSASYVVGTKNIVEELAIPFTEKFLSDEEIKEAKSGIKDETDKAKKTIGDSEYMKDEQKTEYNQYIDEATKFIQDTMTTNGLKNVHQGDADKAIELAGDIQTEARETVTAAEAKVIKDKLGDYFGGEDKIPADVLKLAAQFPDGMLDIIKNNPGLLNDIDALKRMLSQLKINPNSAVSAVKSLQTSGKIALLSLGGLLGLGAIVGGANAVKVATTNKKAVNAKTGKIKSSKKLAVLSAFIGLASLAGSIGTMLYLFLVQGGL